MVERMNDREESGARLEHVAPLPLLPCPRSKFDALLLAWLDLEPRHGRDGLRDGRRAAMLRALDNRATWIQIRHWRRGNAPAPKWAIDLLNTKIDRRQYKIELARFA